jgi:hypothetical protein
MNPFGWLAIRRRTAALGLALVGLAGCGNAAGLAARSLPAAVASVIPMPSPSPSPSPTMAPAAVAPAVPAPMVPPRVAANPLRFPLMAVGEPVSGEVVVTPAANSYQVQVLARGLPPGSTHSVHLHFGNCPSTGVHIVVLGTLVADAGGSGSMSATLFRPYSGNGRFVIVYVGPSAGPLAACAQLSG